METRLIVCGGVDFNDYSYLKNQLDRLIAYYENIRLVSGHARGADTLAERYAAEKSIPIQVFPAEWNKYGKAAGPIRNRAMLEYPPAVKSERTLYAELEIRPSKQRSERNTRLSSPPVLPERRP